MFTKLIVLASLLLGSGLARAKTVVITDIDDTLKQSHVLNRRDMAENAFRFDNPFLGMNGVLYALQKEVPAVQFYYVSTAPEKVMRGQHTRFLMNNHFPAGPLMMRKNVFDENFKVVTIRRILSEQKPDQVVFIGDNGERDTLIYEQMQKEFSKIPSRTFIHIAYSKKNSVEAGAGLQVGQLAYATSFDLMMQLSALGLIRDTTTGLFFQTYAKTFLAETFEQVDGAMTVPPWVDCRDFQWPFVMTPPVGNIIEAVRGKIIQRCSLPPVIRLVDEAN
jgi:hypothetical protein